MEVAQREDIRKSGKKGALGKAISHGGLNVCISLV
jgi:hypothetical protein